MNEDRIEFDPGQAAVLPPRLAPSAGRDDPDVAATLDGERKLFELRRGVRLGQKSQLKERAAQLGEEIQGHLALQKAKAEEIELIQRELEGVRELWSKNLVQINRLISLQREAARLTGERAQSMFAMAQSRGKISEIELQILQIDQDLSGEVAKELRELKDRVEIAIADRHKSERLDLAARMKALAEDSGFSLEEILGSGRKVRGSGKGSAAAKFRNPENPSETWTGRGRMPTWLNEKLKKRGTSKEDFAI